MPAEYRTTPRHRKLRAALYPLQAYAFARMRDTSACTAVISKARTHVEHSAHEDEPPYLYWVRPAEVASAHGRGAST
ncbi:MAG: hypothetical protein ACRDRV_01100 [Pseudonocardiaceae bacterium]